MSTAVFVKHHTDPARGLAARRHRDWLEALGSGVRLPAAHPGSATLQILERLHGTTPGPGDLPDLASVLGRLHGTAFARHLHSARLDQPFAARPDLTIPDFRADRGRVLSCFDIDLRRPVAFYKDANLRNFLLTADGPALVDFDDLTLAPFGYDLAKLVVSTAMTHGHLPIAQITAALDTYCDAVTATGGPSRSCSLPDLAIYSEIHHALTARYLHCNGYHHPWPDVRPWSEPR